MIRRYVNLSVAYALLGMAGGVFYREYTKFSGYAGQTSLCFMHAHYLVLGMAMAALGMNVDFKAIASRGRMAVLASFLASILLAGGAFLAAKLLF